jgi:hypothetical protein
MACVPRQRKQTIISPGPLMLPLAWTPVHHLSLPWAGQLRLLLPNLRCPTSLLEKAFQTKKITVN